MSLHGFLRAVVQMNIFYNIDKELQYLWHDTNI